MSKSEDKIQEAVAKWKHGNYAVKASFAREMDVDYQLFISRLGGRKSKHDTRPSNNRLTISEENAVLHFLLFLDDCGIPATSKILISTAMDVLRRRPDALEPMPLDRQWARRFLEKHKEALTIQRDTVQELDRVAAEDPAVIEPWFRDFKAKIDRCGIQPGDCYNMDATGFNIGVGKPEKVIVRVSKDIKKKRQRRQISSSKETNRERISIVECIDANDGYLSPMVIAPSKSDTVIEDWI